MTKPKSDLSSTTPSVSAAITKGEGEGFREKEAARPATREGQNAPAEMLYEDGYGVHRSIERVVAIEYHPHSRHGLLPFSVFTTAADQPRATRIATYDFEWCERDETLYFHNSGSGGRFYLHPICQPTKKPRCAVWWDHSLTFPTNGGKVSGRAVSDRTVRTWGYDILTVPVSLFSSTTNPFENGSEDSTEYCGRCRDWLPTESLCEHIWWCEKCGGYSAPGERCKHRRANQ